MSGNTENKTLEKASTKAFDMSMLKGMSPLQLKAIIDGIDQTNPSIVADKAAEKELLRKEEVLSDYLDSRRVDSPCVPCTLKGCTGHCLEGNLDELFTTKGAKYEERGTLPHPRITLVSKNDTEVRELAEALRSLLPSCKNAPPRAFVTVNQHSESDIVKYFANVYPGLTPTQLKEAWKVKKAGEKKAEENKAERPSRDDER